MFSHLLRASGMLALSLSAAAAIQQFPPTVHTQEIQTDGATIHVRVGGQGPAVVMLHGFGDTGDMWGPLARELARDHTVIIPDLRGMGLSSHPEQGYDKKTEGGDIAHIMDTLKIQKADLVTHDIGNMVGYAFAAQYPDRVTRFVVMDAPLPGVGPWDEITRSHALWHFSFRGPDAERLVAGRERIYLDRFWNEFAANPKAIDESTREHYAALYAKPHAMHDAFNQFAAFDQDAIDNKAFAARAKLTMPVLAIGADKSFGPTMALDMRSVATNVTELVIANSGHWLMEEQPSATVAAVRDFLDRKP
jgi:pimeloyl-ACP methyl ester carboxylesterase